MTENLRTRLALAGTLLIAAVAAAALGCRPAPAPAPAPVVVQTAQPRPTTDEWVRVPTRITYDRGSAYLTDTTRAMLNEAHASMANRTDIVRVRIEGHADDGGSEERNNLLAQERAQNVMDYLVGTLRMPRELFEVQSFGNNQPLTSGTTQSDEAANRRVEVSILVRRQAAY